MLKPLLRGGAWPLSAWPAPGDGSAIMNLKKLVTTAACVIGSN